MKKTIKKTNKKLIAVIVVVILGSVSIACMGNKVLSSKSGLDQDKYTVLKSGSNITKVNVKGQVKSETNTNVYSTANLQIKEVNVEVGDKVKAGDILAVLDTSKLQDQINELEATIASTEAANEVALRNAKAVYENALSLSSDENNMEIKNAETALNSAKLDYENKKELYEKNNILYENGSIPEQQLKEYKIAYENAEYTYNQCVVTLNNTKAKIQLELTTAKDKYDEAKIKCEDKSQRISLENLKKDLDNAEIKSPVDGVISVKNASEGNPSTGVLFEIQDENDITVRVDVKEVDIQKIEVGQLVEMKTDSTGTDIINGEVISIQSIANPEDDSLLDLNSDSNDKEAEYEVKIKVTDTDYNLKVGMKVQADIIIDKTDNAYVVPSESIIKDKDDNDCLYIAQKQGESYVVEQINVTKGTENDVNVEVLGDEIQDGVIVLNSPADYELGSKIKIKGR